MTYFLFQMILINKFSSKHLFFLLVLLIIGRFYLTDTISKFEEEKEKLFTRYEQLSEQQHSSSHIIKYNSIFIQTREWNIDCVNFISLISGKRERSMITEQEKACGDKIAQLEESLKKKKQVHNYKHWPWLLEPLFYSIHTYWHK